MAPAPAAAKPAAARAGRGSSPAARRPLTARPAPKAAARVATKAPQPKPAAAQDDRPRRSRLAPQLREQMILEAAVDFFAEHGFEAQTRDLAARLGISQGLIFRYFKTKQVLVEQCIRGVRPALVQGMGSRLKDRDVPLQERLERFYLSYFQAVDESHWIRVSLYAGLSGSDIITQYIETHVNRLLKVIQREMRVYRGLSDRVTTDPLEFELVWHLHSTFIYVLVRKHIHHQR